MTTLTVLHSSSTRFVSRNRNLALRRERYLGDGCPKSQASGKAVDWPSQSGSGLCLGIGAEWLGIRPEPIFLGIGVNTCNE
jgi:hypothetical protein